MSWWLAEDAEIVARHHKLCVKVLSSPPDSKEAAIKRSRINVAKNGTAFESANALALFLWNTQHA